MVVKEVGATLPKIKGGKRRGFILRFGALADPLYQQLREQGIEAGKVEMDNLQGCAEAIIHLRANGVIPDHIKDALQRRLMKKITEFLEAKVPELDRWGIRKQVGEKANGSPQGLSEVGG